jgi:hypothetical protein
MFPVKPEAALTPNIVPPVFHAVDVVPLGWIRTKGQVVVPVPPLVTGLPL